MNWMRKFKVAWQTRWMVETDKTRWELRRQLCEVEGKTMRVLDYIDIVASRMVRVVSNGQAIDHREKLREIYYKYDMPGLNYYVKHIIRLNKREVKKLSRKIKVVK